MGKDPAEDQPGNDGDEILRRLLKTPPQPKEAEKKGGVSKQKPSEKPEK
ncbi:MAG: hypothetical protein H5U13_00375 [Parvibaculum sp.]|nr:hypothetical protein [Parvibaculum sp.]